MGQAATTCAMCVRSAASSVAGGGGNEKDDESENPLAANNPYMRSGTPDTSQCIPPLPPRCCLPQVDPNVRGRIMEIHEATLSLPIMKERQVNKSNAINRDRSFKEDNFKWQPRPNGMPFEFPTPTWERKFSSPTAVCVLTMRMKSILNTSPPYMFTPGNPPSILSDDEFVRCRLSGCNPTQLHMVIKKSHLPKHLRVAEYDLSGLIGKYENLGSAITAKKIFIVDYSVVLAGVKLRPGTHLCTPVALFFLDDAQKKLRPIAIQLHTDPTVADRYEPVYTPQDNLWAWTIAKLYFNHADLHVHLCVSLLVHTVMVPCIVNLVMQRTMSVNHPIRQFLSHHMHATIPFYNAFLDTVEPVMSQFLSVTPEGAHELACNGWRLYNFSNVAFSNNVLERFDPSVNMPGNDFVEHGKILWKAIEENVKAFVMQYYDQNDHISEDSELQAFIHELASNINRIMELNPARAYNPIIFNLTAIIFMTTGMFGALTSPMVPQYMKVEGFPGYVSRPPHPTKLKDEFTHDDFLATLPTQRMASTQVAFVRVMSGMLSQHATLWPSVSLGNYMRDVCQDRNIASLQHQIILDALKKAKDEMLELNKKEKDQGRTEYVAMLPNNLLQGFGYLLHREFDSLKHSNTLKIV
eukprot:PhF_6_TR11588/c0_g1_i2/m.18754/K00461/ALOX5; arachidonate 5-lipoxygenase